METIKKICLFVKRWWLEGLLIIAGIHFLKAIHRHNNKIANKENGKTKDLIQKINDTEKKIEKLKEVKKGAYKNNSRADNISSIRRMLPRHKRPDK